MKYIAAGKILALVLIAGAPLVHAAAGESTQRDAAPMQAGGPKQPGMPPMGGPQCGMPPFMAGLSLSEAQQDKLFEIRYKQEPAVHAQMKAARKAHDALHALIGTPEYTPAKAKDLAQVAARAEAELELIRAQGENDVLALLSDEQKKQLAERREHKGEGPRGMMPPPAGQHGEGGPYEGL